MTKSTLVRNIAGGHFVLGIVVFVVQTFSGQTCNTLIGERRVSGRGVIATALQWLPDMVRHVGSGDVREFFSPRCG